MAGSHTLLFKILLMVFFGAIELRCRPNFGDNRSIEDVLPSQG